MGCFFHPKRVFKIKYAANFRYFQIIFEAYKNLYPHERSVKQEKNLKFFEKKGFQKKKSALILIPKLDLQFPIPKPGFHHTLLLTLIFIFWHPQWIVSAVNYLIMV